jgi:hypothetical protein
MNANFYFLMADGTVKHFIAKDGRATVRTLISKVHKLHHVFHSTGTSGAFAAGGRSITNQEEYFVRNNCKQYIPDAVEGRSVDEARAAMIANVSETIEL